MKEINHEVDLCVVGGGLAGLCAAVSAARHGIKVALMQDRPVLGGNSSSEIRMWVCGAHGENRKETGLIEEFELENYYRNPNHVFSLWDMVLYEKARFEPNITLLLNCTCTEAEMDGEKISSVRGWQMTSETWHRVKAVYFADCSGDSILAPLTGAPFMRGREAKEEFGESIPPDTADDKTMGMSCLFQLREYPEPQPFIPPDWAYTYETAEELRHKDLLVRDNFWWIELGGDRDEIHDTEVMRDELLKIAMGVWDHMKNRGDYGAENWAIDWIGFLPGKRESRRYVGEYIVNQNDVEAEGRFDDLVAYGGWSMDDHFPAGFYHQDSYPTIFHPAPSPWGIPFRSLYSKTISNLLFAGRNISVTHAALSSCRVMATCALLGQAVGTAAAMAVHADRPVQKLDIPALQQQLMEDDCFLPWLKREVWPLTKQAETNCEKLRNGIDRDWDGEENKFSGKPGEAVWYRFTEQKKISRIRLVFDSDLSRRDKNMPCCFPLKDDSCKVPATLVREYKVMAITKDGEKELLHVKDNHQRLVYHPVETEATEIRVVPLSTWGAENCHIFAMDVE